MDHNRRLGVIVGLLGRDNEAASNQIASALRVGGSLVSCACQQVQGVSKSNTDACQCCGLEYKCRPDSQCCAGVQVQDRQSMLCWSTSAGQVDAYGAQGTMQALLWWDLKWFEPCDIRYLAIQHRWVCM
jgi:hypothetical protein